MRTGLYFFQHDLRLIDMPALHQINEQVEQLILVYLAEPRALLTEFGFSSCGQQRARFIDQSLADLQDQLKELGQCLYFCPDIATLSNIITSYAVTDIGYSLYFAPNERKQITTLKQRHPHLKTYTSQANYLYHLDDLPFSLSEMPATFSPFRRKVETHSRPRSVNNAQINFKPPVLALAQQLNAVANEVAQEGYIVGGERAALKQLSFYCDDPLLLGCYKETRNGLDGWNFSSKLSAYLAHGNVSPAQILAAIKQFEAQFGANDSSYWLFFELLWREFFHWHLNVHQHKLFAYHGVRGVFDPQTKGRSEQLDKWISGQTGYPIVDACMRQLQQTGFMSNRGRQLVASCFVHELRQDWRFGAAYFEEALVDFDVASNWGNWQYLAGVGADPRGHRKFNLEKQALIYDPQQHFQQRWLAN